jgi:A/G-specific adenine glycosylase
VSKPFKQTTNEMFFRSTVLRWFGVHGRAHLPWRLTRDPWRVLVSEMMLQQTQVERVIPKYRAFLRAWPSARALARASLGDVLRAWSGLGYNRRARFLHEAARAVVALPGGAMPRSVAALEALPGIGRYTARAVMAFAWNEDVALWDTNVRRIFLRFFHGGEFARRALPDAAALEAALERVLPRGRSRDWHGALMDFGSAVCTSCAPACGTCPLRARCKAAPRFLAGAVPVGALNKKQSALKGSRREVRGAVLKTLAEHGPLTRAALLARLRAFRLNTPEILATLIKEGLIVAEKSRLRLP